MADLKVQSMTTANRTGRDKSRGADDLRRFGAHNRTFLRTNLPNSQQTA
jgi:hypothetical protein